MSAVKQIGYIVPRDQLQREDAVAQELKASLEATGRRTEEGLASNGLRLFVNGRWYNIEVTEY